MCGLNHIVFLLPQITKNNNLSKLSEKDKPYFSLNETIIILCVLVILQKKVWFRNGFQLFCWFALNPRRANRIEAISDMFLLNVMFRLWFFVIFIIYFRQKNKERRISILFFSLLFYCCFDLILYLLIWGWVKKYRWREKNGLQKRSERYQIVFPLNLFIHTVCRELRIASYILMATTAVQFLWYSIILPFIFQTLLASVFFISFPTSPQHILERKHHELKEMHRKKCERVQSGHTADTGARSFASCTPLHENKCLWTDTPREWNMISIPLRN